MTSRFTTALRLTRQSGLMHRKKRAGGPAAAKVLRGKPAKGRRAPAMHRFQM
jgi:hypothetical protein